MDDIKSESEMGVRVRVRAHVNEAQQVKVGEPGEYRTQTEVV